MKQPSEQEENIVCKALCELITILNEIDLDMKNKDKCRPDEIVLKNKKEKTTE